MHLSGPLVLALGHCKPVRACEFPFPSLHVSLSHLSLHKERADERGAHRRLLIDCRPARGFLVSRSYARQLAAAATATADLAALITSERGTIGDFKVESVLDHRVIVQCGKCVDQFKTKWAGWERDEDLTWEPLAHFKSEAHIARCNALIAEKTAAAQTAKAPRGASSSAQSPAEDAKVASAAVGSEGSKEAAKQQAKLDRYRKWPP